MKELSVVHERAWKAMKSMAKALWPSDTLPESMKGLASLFKGARRRFELWKTFACREGAREAWAMVKTRFTKLDPNPMARVGPQGPDGKEIPLNLVYDQVMIAAKYSQEDCGLDSVINGIDIRNRHLIRCITVLYDHPVSSAEHVEKIVIAGFRI